jgi:hypothetical protein
MKNFIPFILLPILTFFRVSDASDFDSFKATEKFHQLFEESVLSNNTYQQDESEILNLLTPSKIKNQPQFFQANGIDFNAIPWDRILKILAPYLMNYGTQRAEVPLDELLKWEKKFGGNIKNFGTLEWQEPLGYFSIHNRREIDASNSSKVEVNDVLEIVINAESYLKHLSNLKLIEITDDQLSAFAKIKYHKIFRYKHFKNSLEDARKADLSTLLFPFKFFHFPDLLKLKREDEISHSDYLSFNINGSASANFWTFIKAGVSVEATLEHNQATVIKITRDAQQDEIYQMKKSIGTIAKLGVDASVALDLFKLIDLTLIKLSFEFVYEKSRHRYYHAPFVSNVFNLNLQNYFVGEELSTSKRVNLDSSFLLWGKSTSSESEYSHIKSENEQVRIHQEWWSREVHVHSLFGGIISSFLGDLLSSFLGFSKKFSSHHEYTFAEDTEGNEFQFDFSRSMYLDNRSSFWSLSQVKYMNAFINKHDLIPENVKTLWNQKYFHKNIYVSDRFNFSQKVFSHMQWLGPHHFQISSVYLCDLAQHPAIDLNSPEQPIHFNQLKWKQKQCIKNSYDKLMQIMKTSNPKEKTQRFLKFIKHFLKHSPNNLALYYLFPQNFMSHQTTVLAKSKSGEKFKGSYNRGDIFYPTLNHYYLNRFNLWR